ncbi:ABC transporter substrate-binding protein [Agreia pratensis]|uniref:ABC transporter substrate-binding protein n=1 Tax=Agreia pratensis TaxID=150121 RepID=UPI001889DA6C|nr:ABC transporter substrate-binding protein [Agreia pratensis]MBF4635326.1 ABC transporter substrate-binding protein [Agreia pratensis]
MSPNRRRVSSVIAIIVSAGVALTGCAAPRSESPATAPAAGYPVSVESCGVKGDYTQAPSRVVLGYPRTLETLAALGVDDSVYGYTLGGYDALPTDYPANIVEVSPDYAPSREAMIAAAPDLYLANDEGQVLGEGTVSYDDLAQAGTNVYVLGQYCANAPAPTSITRVYDDVTDLGAIFGVPDRAADVVSTLKDRVAAAAAKNPGSPLSVAYLQVYDGKIYANGGYPAAGILNALNVTNVFADLPHNFTEITKEQALVLTPDVIMVNYVGADNEQAGIDDVRALQPDSPAVKNGRVYGSDETDYEAGGVSLITNLEYVADTLFSR